MTDQSAPCVLPGQCGTLPYTADIFVQQPLVDLSRIEAVLPAASAETAMREITSWSTYRPTPLLALPHFAEHIGVQSVVCKDESQRFGKGGVKALGAPYGLHAMLKGRADLPEAVAATDGNHGLALAWAAGELGVPCRIFVSVDVDAPRVQRLVNAGAQISVTEGTYDDAVEEAARYAADSDARLLITDTDYSGDLDVTRHIMAGYAVLGCELADQTADKPPTHILLQCGVGGMAAGVIAGYIRARGMLDARLILVEPVRAACLHASLSAGSIRPVPGDLRTHMMGLSCGAPSLPAWDILRDVACGAVAIGDDIAIHVQEMMQAGRGGDAPFACGDTGVAGIAALCEVTASGQAAKLGLNVTSRVAVVNSEGPIII